MIKKVTVLLSSYNGEKYIKDQLESIYSQENVELSVLVRDDGSTDSTADILSQEQNNGKLKFVPGNNVGFCKSFWELIMSAPDSDYYALCDQDDIWLKDKLSSAIKMLEKENVSIPLLYTTNVIPVDEQLNEMHIKTFNVNTVFSYALALRCPALPGCTYVFNKKLLNRLRDYKGFFYLHDWLIYIVALALGKVIYDPNPKILYRQHANNALGVDSTIDKVKHKLQRFFKPKYPRAKSKVAEGILTSYGKDLSIEKRQLTSAFAYYYKDFHNVMLLLKYKEYRTSSFIIQLLLKKI